MRKDYKFTARLKSTATKVQLIVNFRDKTRNIEFILYEDEHPTDALHSSIFR